MIRNPIARILLILGLTALAAWISASDIITIRNPFTQQKLFERNVAPRLGLDLQGGLQVLLEADLPASADITAEDMEIAKTIIENRTNALGVSENLLQVAGDRLIVGEFPGVDDADAVLETIQQTGLLEFVDTGPIAFNEGDTIYTDFNQSEPAPEGTTVYRTVMTGRDLQSISVAPGTLGGYSIDFVLTAEGGDVFAEHTAANVGNFLTIVLDKKVISSPRINAAIIGGAGSITGTFTAEEANAFAIQLRYGSLPIPLKVVETRIIGPTLGEDSLQKSLLAGIIGSIIVFLFMIIYYRLPGFMAVLAIIFYAVFAFALFKFIPVTLTLPGIAGFLLSTGSALDANILVFERLKEELRSGRTLAQAFEQAWTRAWPSIRDSNIAALITAGILFWFGSAFGASIVKGFALTLALGVTTSLFAALFVTRTLLGITFDIFKPTNYSRWIGL